jgi:hypothetical protein
MMEIWLALFLVNVDRPDFVVWMIMLVGSIREKNAFLARQEDLKATSTWPGIVVGSYGNWKLVTEVVRSVFSDAKCD